MDAKTVTLTPATVDTLIHVQRQLMADWSEATWCAGWMQDLEHRVWDGSAYGAEMAAYDDDVMAIHEIARLTGVWCLMDATVPLDEWEAQHGPPLTRMANRVPTPEQEAILNRVYERQVQHWRDIGILND